MNKHILSLASFLLLTACTTKLDQLRLVEPVGTPFQLAIAEEYLIFSESEADSYDWKDSSYFAHKGLIATYGHDPLPEDPRDWKIPPTMRPTAKQAYDDLKKLLTEELKFHQPQLAAETQFTFDCWLEELEENWQTEHIDACREGFFNALDKVYAWQKEQQELKDLLADAAPAAGGTTKASTPAAKTDEISLYEKPKEHKPVALGLYPIPQHGNVPSITKPTKRNFSKPKKVAAVVPQQTQATPDVETVSYMLFFDFNSSVIDGSNTAIIQNIVKDINAMGKADIVLHGHADRVGTEPFNLVLSKNRARQVKEKLLQYGVNEKDVTFLAFGETENLVPTKDGIKEPKNRRVEIFIGE